MAATSADDGWIWPNFKLIGAPMHNLLLATINEKDRLKKSREKVVIPFSPIKTLWELSVAKETRILIRSGPKPNTDPIPK